VIVDAFHGAGGWAEAIAKLSAAAGSLRDVAARGIEIDPTMVATARAAGHDVHLGDVAATDPREVTRGERCTGFIGGPPCPSFSAGGKQLGRDDLPIVRQLVAELAEGIDRRASAPAHDRRSLLTAEPMRWVQALDPDWIALEQVPAVMPVWRDMAGILAERGYSTWTGVLSAEAYGVPQTRQRAILLASRLGDVAEPEPTHRRFYPPRDRRASCPPDGHLPLWRSMADATGWDPEDMIGFARRNDRDDGHTHRVRDLRAAELPAFALTEKARSWARVHRGETLRVGIEEASVLQGFRPDYPWQGSRTKQFAQCANAIPVGLAEAVLAEVTGACSYAVAA
jgi:DNA (cytosine-5)-methyltransferase 1